MSTKYDFDDIDNNIDDDEEDGFKGAPNIGTQISEPEPKPKPIPPPPKPKPRPTPVAAPERVERPEPPQLSKEDTKSIEKAAAAAAKLSKNLEAIDFNLEKFLKFEKKVSSFKLKNTLITTVVSLLIGGYIGSFAQSSLNDYYIKNEVKKLGGELQTAGLLSKYGIKIQNKEDILQIFIQKQPNTLGYDTDQFSVLQITKGDKK
ncbi:MAG: hypothetical protein RBT59_13840 [Arcobacteraceae bacterium]|jgi:hypothetical protein|nr:hypothetical protein [Arcobacteraceae bacterium]